MRILTEPKNALVKQYQKLLEYDMVDLEFEPQALEEAAEKAIERGIGARGPVSYTHLDVYKRQLGNFTLEAPEDLQP